MLILASFNAPNQIIRTDREISKAAECQIVFRPCGVRGSEIIKA